MRAFDHGLITPGDDVRSMQACWRALLLGAIGVLLAFSAHADEYLTFAVARLPLSLPVYVAQARNYFAQEGVRLKVTECDTGRECLGRMLGGAADIATVADSPIVFASLRGQHFAILATLATARRFNKIVTRSDGAIASPADLVGKHVGVVAGTSAQYFLDLTLMFYGIDPARVTIVPVEPTEAASALSRRDVDGVATFEPYVLQAMRQLGPRGRLLPNPPLHRDNWNLVATSEAAHTRRADLEGLCRALARANDFIAREPEAARSILRERLGLDEPSLDWVRADVDFRMQLARSLLSSLEGQARWAVLNNYAKGPTPAYLDYVQHDILAAAVPGAVAVLP